MAKTLQVKQYKKQFDLLMSELTTHKEVYSVSSRPSYILLIPS